MVDVVHYFLELPVWELLAVLLSIAYVVLVSQNNSLCWPAAFISTLIFTVLFYDVSLLMESLLNVYYMAMAIYGWYCWKNSSLISANNTLAVSKWPLKHHIKLISVLSIISLLLGYLMDNFTQADYAYLDTFTTVFAISTTYLVAIKLFENWFYWIIINSVSAYLYLQKGLEPTAFLAMFNVFMCIVGLIKWSSIYQQQTAAEMSSVTTN